MIPWVTETIIYNAENLPPPEEFRRTDADLTERPEAILSGSGYQNLAENLRDINPPLAAFYAALTTEQQP